MDTLIHPTAIVDADARIGEGVTIGPFAVVEDAVVIGDGSTIGSHALIAHGTTLGKSCHVFHGASVGTIPQDLKYKGETTILTIGDNTIIREFCTINRGTIASGKTVIGRNCALLAYCHVAHDCVLGDDVVMSNNVGLAGHVQVGNNVGMGGFIGVHQFSRIGDYSFIGANIWLRKDVIPFALIGGNMNAPRIAGINSVGLERNGFDSERRQKLKRAFRMLFKEQLSVQEALGSLTEQFPGDTDVSLLVQFVKDSERGIYRMKD